MTLPNIISKPRAHYAAICAAACSTSSRRTMAAVPLGSANALKIRSLHPAPLRGASGSLAVKPRRCSGAVLAQAERFQAEMAGPS